MSVSHLRNFNMCFPNLLKSFPFIFSYKFCDISLKNFLLLMVREFAKIIKNEYFLIFMISVLKHEIAIKTKSTVKIYYLIIKYQSL